MRLARWFFWRLQVAGDLRERYGLGMTESWRRAGTYRDRFEREDPASSVVWDD